MQNSHNTDEAVSGSAATDGHATITDDVIERYSRQMIVPGMGKQGKPYAPETWWILHHYRVPRL